MASYVIMRSCGHEEKVFVEGGFKRNEWRLERMKQEPCSECAKKIRDEENARNAEEAEAAGYPELKGSYKQIEWATTIRNTKIAELDKMAAEDPDIKARVAKAKGRAIEMFVWSSWWIDRRAMHGNDLLEEIEREVSRRGKIEDDKLVPEEIKAETTVYPEEQKKKLTATVEVGKDWISASYPEPDDDFKRICKYPNKMKWSSYKWRRSDLNEITGSAEDRAAQLGNALLRAGFPVMVQDETVRSKMIAADYEPECDHWIMYDAGKKLLRIVWYDHPEENIYYNRGRCIHGAKWRAGGFDVPLESFDEVEDYADINDFKFTNKSAAVVEEYKEAKKKALRVKAAEPEELEEPEDKLAAILESDREVIEDLKDDI